MEETSGDLTESGEGVGGGGLICFGKMRNVLRRALSSPSLSSTWAGGDRGGGEVG